MNERIYLDHAATTPLDPDILKEMLPYFCENFGNADSPHASGRKAMAGVDRARDALAALWNARQNEVYFTSGGTESDNWAILGGARAKRKEDARRTQIVISAIEHHAALFAAEALQAEGFEITVLPVNEGGRVALNDVKACVCDRTALVCLMSANNETGVLQPVREAAEIAHEAGALFFTDAVQLAPYLPIDVQALGADMLSVSSHKFYGPKGCGALYVKNGVRIGKLVGGGEQERGLRGGTLNVPAIVGMAAAYAKNRAEMHENAKKIQELSEFFLQRLSVLDGVERNGDKENILPAILNLRFSGVENTSLLYRLDLAGVSIAAGSACASASVKPSHVLTAMGMDERRAKECVRVSLGKHNTAEQLVRAAELIVEAVKNLRGEL